MKSYRVLVTRQVAQETYVYVDAENAEAAFYLATHEIESCHVGWDEVIGTETATEVIEVKEA